MDIKKDTMMVMQLELLNQFRISERTGGKEKDMAEIKIEKGHGIIYECPECEHDVELGQNYCQECGEPLEWKEDYE